MHFVQTLAVGLAAIGAAQAAKNGKEDAQISLSVQDGCTVSLLLVPTRAYTTYFRTSTQVVIDAKQVTSMSVAPRVIVQGQVRPTQIVTTQQNCAQYQRDRNGQCATLSAFVYESQYTQYVTSTSYVTYPVVTPTYITRRVESTSTGSYLVPTTTTSALNRC